MRWVVVRMCLQYLRGGSQGRRLRVTFSRYGVDREECALALGGVLLCCGHVACLVHVAAAINDLFAQLEEALQLICISVGSEQECWSSLCMGFPKLFCAWVSKSGIVLHTTVVLCACCACWFVWL